MDKEQAIKVLCSVARAACQKGILSLEDAEVVAGAVRLCEAAPAPVKAPETAPAVEAQA